MDDASKDIYDFREYISRYDHSLTVCLIVYKLTKDKKATLAGLFHDIATPCFSHVIDYMNQDYENQEERFKCAYLNGVVKMNEFDNELKSIRYKIDNINNKIKEIKQRENLNFTTNDLLILEDTETIDTFVNPDIFLTNILNLINASREEMKRIIGTYIDNIEVNKIGDKI